MKAICVIPSRFASTRLPGKPLVEINGKPLIQWVYERASQAKRFERVIVATDDERIREAVKGFGGEAIMSPPSLPTGSDRVARVMQDMNLDHDVIMNLQGDEPLIDPTDLDRLVECFEDEPETQMASLMAPLENEEDILDENQVKCVVDRSHFALYFSRHAIPFWRGRKEAGWANCPARYWMHLGVYAFSRSTLAQYAGWPRSMLEQSESLEQLRALENGVRIKMITTPHPWPGVNTPDDVERVRKALKESMRKL
ncbi:MAG: 3-deoxy-manno-octulosonate cytidylyltransferase [Candidatus Omnitrophica bacterium]|nr:3-deoxy-manno-octulosonate cytidylyltransferase [Candidatus Omnitrophota bacterium]